MNLLKLSMSVKLFFSFTIQTDSYKTHVKENAKSAVRQSLTNNIFCSSDVLEFILDLFVRCRLHFLLKCLNNKMQTVPKCTRNRKATKIMNE